LFTPDFSQALDSEENQTRGRLGEELVEITPSFQTDDASNVDVDDVGLA
jgi:hypothetical protein